MENHLTIKVNCNIHKKTDTGVGRWSLYTSRKLCWWYEVCLGCEGKM